MESKNKRVAASAVIFRGQPALRQFWTVALTDGSSYTRRFGGSDGF